MPRGKKETTETKQLSGIKFSVDEYTILQSLADKEGKSVPKWVKDLLLSYIADEKEKYYQDEIQKLKAELEQLKSKDTK